MTRSEALNLLQVLLLDERKVPPLKAASRFGSRRRLAAKQNNANAGSLPAGKEGQEDATGRKARILL